MTPRPHRAAFQKLTFARRPARASVRVPVLMFHRVAGEDTATNAVSRDLTVTPERFAAELAWLAGHGYHRSDSPRSSARSRTDGRCPRGPSC